MRGKQAQAKQRGTVGRITSWGKRMIAWMLATKPARAVLLYTEQHGAMLADSVTYRALFSVLAGVFLGFAIGGIWLSGRPDVMEALVTTIDAAIPGLVGEGDLIDPDELIQPITLSIVGIIGLVGVVVASIGAIESLRKAFRDLADQSDTKIFFLWLILRDLALAIGFGATLALAAAVTFFSTAILETLLGWFGVSERSWLYDGATRAVSILVIFVIDTVLIAAMFRLMSGLRPNARTLWSGALIGGVGLTVLQVLSSLFVAGASRNPLFASFGSVIALLLWFNFSAQVILIAAAYIIVGVDEEHDRVHARHSAPTLAIRRMQRAERRATDAAAELAAAREAVERERQPAGDETSEG